jgi:hypothetical protein
MSWAALLLVVIAAPPARAARVDLFLTPAEGGGVWLTNLTRLSSDGQYVLAAVWSEGDWNGDGRFDSNDLTVAMRYGHYEATPARAVPEPAHGMSTIAWLMGFLANLIRPANRLMSKGFS